MNAFFAEIRMFASKIAVFRSILLHLALLGALGIWVPHLKGIDFFDPQILGAYACLGLFFSGPATAQLFVQGVPASFPQANARVLVGVLYGEIMAAFFLAIGIATVYLTNRGAFIPQPDWPTLARSSIFGLGLSWALASLAALLTVRISKSMATFLLRLAFFGILLLFFYKGQSLPELGLAGASAGIVLAAVFTLLLRRACA
jgi:hypothetical protein